MEFWLWMPQLFACTRARIKTKINRGLSPIILMEKTLPLVRRTGFVWNGKPWSVPYYYIHPRHPHLRHADHLDHQRLRVTHVQISPVPQRQPADGLRLGQETVVCPLLVLREEAVAGEQGANVKQQGDVVRTSNHVVTQRPHLSKTTRCSERSDFL